MTPDQMANYILYKKYKKLEWFVEVVTLTQGQSFGELALINNEPRAATIKTIADCSFGIIGRHDYKKVLEKLETKRIEAKIKFF